LKRKQAGVTTGRLAVVLPRTPEIDTRVLPGVLTENLIQLLNAALPGVLENARQETPLIDKHFEGARLTTHADTKKS
jgi:hypothetical protein